MNENPGHNKTLGLLGLMPSARLVIRNGELFLHRWQPMLRVVPTEHALYRELAASGVFLADLYEDVSGDVRELFVDPLPGHQISVEIRDLIVRWSESCGKHRLWLPDGIVDLRGAASYGFKRKAACPVCGWVLEDDSLLLAAFVNERGRTPCDCRVCGSQSLAQAMTVDIKFDRPSSVLCE